ncbi:MAG: nuclease-related domain-containing protein, partial [Lentisphaerota bacterium]
MARMIPAECSQHTNSPAEEKLFDVLKISLDEGWTVFHSFNTLARNREKKLIDCEIDFLIFHKELGLLSLEVKGGQISFRDGYWLQNGWNLEKGPVEQARFNKYAVIS